MNNEIFRNFDLEAALKGTYQVETVSGEIVRNLRRYNSCKIYSIQGWVNDALYTWTTTGIFWENPESKFNLVTTKKLF